jgi:hypothetical protein
MTVPAPQTPAPATKKSTVGIVLAVLSFPMGFIGIAWLALYYLTAGGLPVPAFGFGNIIIGLLLWLPSFPMLIVGIVLIVLARKK